MCALLVAPVAVAEPAVAVVADVVAVVVDAAVDHPHCHLWLPIPAAGSMWLTLCSPLPAASVWDCCPREVSAAAPSSPLLPVYAPRDPVPSCWCWVLLLEVVREQASLRDNESAVDASTPSAGVAAAAVVHCLEVPR